MILPPTSQIRHHHKVTNITMSPTSLSPLFLIDIIKPIQENSTDEEKIKMYACLGEMEMALPLSFNNNIHLTPFEAITFNHFRIDLSYCGIHAV